jgi:hypothetical protein
MWHTVFTVLKGKGEEGQNKKYLAKKKWKEEKASYRRSKRTQGKIEKNFFWGFCDFMNFFLDFWVYFCSTLLEKQILFHSQLLLPDIIHIRY